MSYQPPCNPILTVTVAAAAVIAANRYVQGDGNYPAANGPALGVTRTSSAAAGDALPVDVLGTTIVESGGVVTAGNPVMVDAAGRVLNRTSTNTIVARALSSASALGQLVEVLLIPNA